MPNPSELATARRIVAEELHTTIDWLHADKPLYPNRLDNIISRLSKLLGREIARPDVSTVGEFLKLFRSNRDVARQAIAEVRNIPLNEVDDDLELGPEMARLVDLVAIRTGQPVMTHPRMNVCEFLRRVRE